MESKNGAEFAGTQRFAIVRRIGAGGMGVVYEAHDQARNERVALKTLPRIDAAALYRFKQEFRALTDVVHPNLAALHELFSVGDRWFFTMELVNGANFLEHVRSAGKATLSESPTSLQSAPTGDAPGTVSYAPATAPATDPDDAGDGQTASAVTDFDRLRQALGQLAEGICALHDAGKLHRDIKPSNVLVAPDHRVVLLDFGLVVELEERPLGPHSQHEIAGTFAYMAPEQGAGLPLSPASDWYSVGVMLYEALTGRRPFVGGRARVLREKQQLDPRAPRELAPGVPEDLDALCVELLRRDPAQRPTGRQLLRRLRRTPSESAAPVRAVPQQRMPFVGREWHLAALGEAYHATRQGRAMIVYVHGRSGVGKTALLQRFLEGLVKHEEVVVLAGRCYERESVPYKALDSLVDALSRYVAGLSRHEATELMPRDVAALARLFPVLRRVQGIAEAPRQTLNPDPQELRRRALTALRELLARLGDRKPLVLYIDDLQWGDVDSATLLNGLFRPPDPPVLLLLGSYRSEYAASSPCLRALLETRLPANVALDRRELAVEALALAEARSLALDLLGENTPAARAQAEAVAQESGGSPYFVRELVQSLQAGGGLRDPSTTAEKITLDDVLWRRVTHLPDSSRRLLEVVTVSGRPLPQADAYQAAGLGADDRAALAILRVGHLARSTGPGEQDEVETYHDRIRETVMAHLAPAALTENHRRLAGTLEASGHADPETLAVHFLGAGEQNRAGHHYAAAADQAAEALAFDRAATLFRRSVELRPVQGNEARTLRTKLGDALANAGRGLEAAREYQAASVGAAPSEELELERRAAFQYCISGHLDEGRAAFRAVLEAIGMKLPATPRRAILSYLMSQLKLRLRGLTFRERAAAEVAASDLARIDITRSVAVGISVVDPIAGANFQTRSLLLALRAGEPSRIALALAWEAAHAALAGGPNWRRTSKLLEAAESVARRVGQPHALGMSLLAKGIGEFFMGRFPPAGEFCDGAEEIFHDRCTGLTWELHTARAFALWSLLYKGELAALRQRFLTLFKEAQERGDRYAAANLGTQIGTLARLAADEVEEAREQLREVMAHWTQHGFNIQHLSAMYGRIYLDLYSGNGKAAWSRIGPLWAQTKGSLLSRIEQVRIDLHQLSGRSALAALESAADPKPLLRVAEGHARALERERVPWAGALAQLLRAGVALGRRELERSAGLLEAAAESFEAVGMGLFAATARRRLGEMVRGDRGRALVEAADAWMVGQKIKNPARMTEAFAPRLLSD